VGNPDTGYCGRNLGNQILKQYDGQGDIPVHAHIAQLELANSKGGGLDIEKGYFFHVYSPIMGGITQVELL